MSRGARLVRLVRLALPLVLVAGVACGGGDKPSGTPATTDATTSTTLAASPAGPSPPVVDPKNIYSEATVGKLSPAARAALPRVYVPDRRTNNVTVIDPATLKVERTFAAGKNPQHVVPSYDMTRLWVANNAEGSGGGSLTPIDPTTGIPGPNVAVDDPYNLYYTPDGANALVVAESKARLDFRDPATMKLKWSIPTPSCPGINHMDFSEDGGYLIATCENAHSLVKVDWAGRRVLQTLDLGSGSLPQDIRLGPDGRTFFVADMSANLLIAVGGDDLVVQGAVDLGAAGGFGAHGVYPSRDGTLLYVANRGSAARGTAARHGRGSVSVVDPAARTVVATWSVPDGGSPDMGGVSADGTQLWLSGRFDNEVYVFNTGDGSLTARIPVDPGGREPHGLCIWPQPGRYSLGHTGNTR